MERQWILRAGNLKANRKSIAKETTLTCISFEGKELCRSQSQLRVVSRSLNLALGAPVIAFVRWGCLTDRFVLLLQIASTAALLFQGLVKFFYERF